MIITAPTNCPSCASLLELVKDQLFCVNSTCPAKQAKLVENFALKMKIKGLGPAAIEKLGLSSILDVYSLSKDNISKVLGYARSKTLYAEIQKSKKASLQTILPALNISLVGPKAAEKICAVVDHIDNIDETECEKAGLGPVATKNLLAFLEFNQDWEYLPFSWNSEKPKEYSKTVCISGRLVSFKNKAEATIALEKQGYKVSTTINKNTDILVNEGGVESSKTAKAKDLGIEIVTNLKQLLKE